MAETGKNHDAAWYKSQIYPLQDRVLKSINNLRLPFYLTGATAFNRFILSGRYTTDLEYQVHNEPQFRTLADEARSAIVAEFGDTAEEKAGTESECLMEIDAGGDARLEVSLRHYSGYHVDGAMAGGVFDDARYGRLDYWLNICTDILARGAKHGIGDPVDLWWMARNYQFDWREVLPLAQKKTGTSLGAGVHRVLDSVTLQNLTGIPWIVAKDPAAVFREIRVMAADLLRGEKNSLAPEPFTEH